MQFTLFQFSRFLATGGIAALVNLGGRYLLNFLVVFEIAVVLAYLLGMITAFVLMRSYVFGASQRFIGAEIYRFVLVNGVALVFVWLVSVGLHRIAFPAVGFTWHPDTVAHAIGVAVPALTSYFGHRFYTFSNGTVSNKILHRKD